MGAAGHEVTPEVSARIAAMTTAEASKLIAESGSFDSIKMNRIFRDFAGADASAPFDEAHEDRRREYAKSGGKGPRPDARQHERGANGVRREDELVFLYVRTGAVTYRIGSIVDMHAGVSLGDAWRRLETMRETEFDSRDALNAAIRQAMTT